jgi:hypothetical protein
MLNSPPALESVDGPPAYEPEDAHRRLPALTFFEPRLVPGAT